MFSKRLTHIQRNEKYESFLSLCRTSKATVEDAMALGVTLLRKHKLHHHFFGTYSWWRGTYPWQATAEALVNHALKQLQSSKTGSDALTEHEALAIFAVFEKRIEDRLPVEYITHEAEYLGRSFYVDERVLVPRSLMNTRFEDFLTETTWTNKRVLDLCTGSGCIGISLALMNPDILVDLVDISPDALAVAQININRYGLNDRVRCIQSDLFAKVTGKYDLIITNPPYVSTKEHRQSPQEFKNEPHVALESGADGLIAIKRILAQAKHHLTPTGWLIVEIGPASVQRLKKQMKCRNFKWLNYRSPTKRWAFLSLFNDPGVFTCKRADLPTFLHLVEGTSGQGEVAQSLPHARKYSDQEVLPSLAAR